MRHFIKPNQFLPLLLALCLLPTLALATGEEDTIITRGGALRQRQYQTYGNLTYFVDGTSGSDTNSCTSSGAGACATIQAAVNKIPKRIRNLVTVNIAAFTTYAGFYLTGFTFDFETPGSAAGLVMQGPTTFTTVTPTTGSATGTLSSVSTPGTGNPGLDTVTDSTATWTVDDFKGQLFVGTSGTGSGTASVIVSNTSTVITLAKGNTNPYAGGTGYAIQTQGAVITTGTTGPPTPLAGGTAGVGIWIGANVWPRSLNNTAVKLENLRVNISTSPALQMLSGGDVRSDNSAFITTAASLGQGIGFQDPAATSSSFFNVVYVSAGSTTTGAVNVGSSNSTGGVPTAGFVDSYIRATGSTFTNGVVINGYGRFLVYSGRVVIDVPNNTSAGYGPVAIRDSGQFIGPIAANAAAWILGNTSADCVQFEAATVGGSGLPFIAGPAVFSSARGLGINNCASAITTAGQGNAMIDIEQTFAITNVTTAFNIAQGGKLRFLLSSGTNTFTTVTNQLLIDGTAYLYTDLTSLTPPTIFTANYGSLVMRAP